MASRVPASEDAGVAATKLALLVELREAPVRIAQRLVVEIVDVDKPVVPNLCTRASERTSSEDVALVPRLRAPAPYLVEERDRGRGRAIHSHHNMPLQAAAGGLICAERRSEPVLELCVFYGQLLGIAVRRDDDKVEDIPIACEECRHDVTHSLLEVAGALKAGLQASRERW